ncbi:hypothetical protein CRE_22670 [Caenorhabditis remanei]|uniref:Uncharacterized protein n=1 Tax=Caenorhabditis remanei TaxID=31234 RepID=E3NFK0_CAERE|nr:hypothetical protein CRE_22670 [Caenorhabditis remanei]
MESLQNTCIQELANCIEDSKFKSYAKLIDGLPSGEKYKYQITPEPSNRIFEILTKGPLRFSSETANEISKVFNVTKVTLTSPIVNDASIDLLQSFNLVELRLLNMKEGRTEDHRYGYKKKFFDIIAALDSILNSKSLKSLRVLKIDGDHTKFNSDWIDQIANVLGPVLQQLDINFCRLPPNPFKTVFNRFPKLTELHVSYSNFSSIQGLSQLKNLEKLSLAGIPLNNADFKELFKLRKLQFLNLSDFDNDRVPTISFVEYSFQEKRNTPHPELKFVDISGCGGHLEMGHIERLVEIYPKLKTIGLIDHFFFADDNIAIPGVKLLQDNTLEQCIDSLDYYLNNWGFQRETIGTIINGIDVQTRWQHDDPIPEEFMIQYLGKVIELIDHGATFTSLQNYEPLGILTQLDSDRLERITPSQRRSLSRYLLALQPHDNQISDYFRLFERCFTSDAFLATPHINYSMVCNKTIDLVLREVSKGGSDRKRALGMGKSILSKCLCKMSRNDETFRKKRFDGLFNYLMTGSDQRSRQAALDILVHVFSFSTNRRMAKNQKVQLKTEIMDCIDEYRQDGSIHIRNLQRFMQTNNTSSGVKNWIDRVMTKM